MATNNAINKTFPLTVADGGTGATSLTDHAVLVGSGTAAITAITVGATGELLVGVTGADPAFGTSADGNFTFTTATAGTDRTLTVSNTDNTAAATSQATVQLTVGGSNVGDPKVQYVVSGEQTWHVGIDNSNNDAFKIASGNELGSSDVMRIDTTGVINFPLLPAFSIYNNTLRSSVTGDGTLYTIPYDTEEFDQGNNMSSGTFTAPISGHYVFIVALQLANVGAAHTSCLLELNTTSSTIEIMLFDPAASDNAGTVLFTTTAELFLTAADTAQIDLTVSGSTKTINVSATVNNRFGGYLLA